MVSFSFLYMWSVFLRNVDIRFFFMFLFRDSEENFCSVQIDWNFSLKKDFYRTKRLI